MTSSTALTAFPPTVDRRPAPLLFAAAAVPLLLIGAAVAPAGAAGTRAPAVLPSGDLAAALRTAAETGVVPELVAIVVLLAALIAPAILLLVRLDAAGRHAATSGATEVDEPWELQGR